MQKRWLKTDAGGHKGTRLQKQVLFQRNAISLLVELVFHSSWIKWVQFVQVKSERDVQMLSNADKPQNSSILSSAFLILPTPWKGAASTLIKLS